MKIEGDMKEFCLELAYCESERAVINLLKEQNLWNNPNAWRFYGDNENNFATIGNQQSRPEAAIVEKIINSVDAVLITECLRKEMNPESSKAPQSIQEALVRFFNIRDGKLSNISSVERLKISEKICLVATGAKANPCYSIIDKGEGQTPNKMPDTILSLGKSNKLRIPFVQGKFNMGGTGVFQFCGSHNIQLVVSKRHPELSRHENDSSKNSWGFTVIRREDPIGGMRSSTYKYLAPSGKILSFDGDTLPLLPGVYPSPYENKLEWGTFIKLYEYQMTGLKTNILFDLYNRLSLLMPTIALPIRFYERRKGYTGHSFETTLSGLSVRLEEDKRENLEDGFPTSSTLSVQGQKMKASIYAFKRGKAEKYTKDEGIIFTVNGQTHGHLPKIFFSRNSVGLGYLVDSMLAIFDCSDFEGRYREDLFMNSRDRLRSGELRSKMENNIEELLKHHPGLKELKERRRREDIENKLEDSKPLADVIQDILKKSPTLSKLFIEGVRLPNPFKVTTGQVAKAYEGKRFPSYFKLIGEFPANKPKICPINVTFRVQYKTDVVNDYFNRDSDPGIFSLKLNGKEIDNYSLNLWNGIANLNINLPPDNRIGEKLHFQSTVEDISKVEPFIDEFYVIINEPIKKRPGKPGPRKLPNGDEEDNKTEKPSYLALPNVIEVRKEDWDKYSFNEKSALKVINNGDDGYDFFVNMDNIHLLTEQKASSNINTKLLDARYKYGMVLVGIALLEEDKKSEASENGKDVYQTIEHVTKILSPILLPMISSLGDLKIEEAIEG